MKTALRIVDAALGPIDVIATRGAGGALLLITVDLFVNSVTRSFFNFSLFGSEELARVLTVWLTFLASYVLVRRKGHIAIDVLARMVSDRAYRWMAAGTSAVGAVTSAYLGWIGYVYAAAIFNSGQEMTTLDAPAGLYYLPVPISGVLMAVAFLHIGLQAAIYGDIERPGTQAAPVSAKAAVEGNGSLPQSE